MKKLHGTDSEFGRTYCFSFIAVVTTAKVKQLCKFFILKKLFYFSFILVLLQL